MNRVLQAALNPAVSGKREKIYGDLLLRQGDRVMQIKNDYDIIWQKEDGAVGTGVFNGDVGPGHGDRPVRRIGDRAF